MGISNRDVDSSTNKSGPPTRLCPSILLVHEVRPVHGTVRARHDVKGRKDDVGYTLGHLAVTGASAKHQDLGVCSYP